jgi:hypothetical protein
MMLIPLFDLKKLMIPSVRTSSCVLGSFPSLSGSQPGGFTPVLHRDERGRARGVPTPSCRSRRRCVDGRGGLRIGRYIWSWGSVVERRHRSEGRGLRYREEYRIEMSGR